MKIVSLLVVPYWYARGMTTTVTRPVEAETVQIVAANIRAEAGRLGMNQSDLGRALGVTRATISKRWHGRRSWQLEDLDAVAAVLGVSVTDLVTPVRGKRRSSGQWLPRLDSNQQPSDYRFGSFAMTEWALVA